jgi:hypothetical protein
MDRSPDVPLPLALRLHVPRRGRQLRGPGAGTVRANTLY